MKASQLVTVEQTPYTISLETRYGVHLALATHDEAAVPQDTTFFEQDVESGEFSYTFTPSSAGQLKVSFSQDAGGSYSILWVQLEKKAYSTSHVKTGSSTTSRGDGILTIPVELNDSIKYEGSLFFLFNPVSSMTTDDRALIEIGNLLVSYNNTTLDVKCGDASGEVIINPDESKWYPVLITWGEDLGRIYVENSLTYITGFMFDETADHICIGFSESTAMKRANALIDNLYILNERNSNIEEFEGGLIKNPFIYVSFDGNISKFDNSIITLPTSNVLNAPIIVQKSDGTELRRMTFMDPDTGNYIAYGIQKLKCSGSNVFEVPFDDIDNETHKPRAYTSNGDFINVIDVDDNKITLDIDPKQYYGQTITMIYQPRNSYTIDYNDNDLCTIMLGRHDGQTLKITYEGNEDAPHRLLTNIDLNAMNNPNHDGFIYATQAVYPIENINYSIFPRALRADGKSKAIIIIDAKDKYGNIVTDVDINVEAEMDPERRRISAPPAGYLMEVPIAQQAGRYIYQYTSPSIDASVDGYVYDNITIKAYKDGVLQMSVKTSIKLMSI